jgi:DinB superfamily
MLIALSLLKDQLKEAHELFENTAADIQEEHVHKDPGGKAFPLGATYAHLVFSEDVIVQGMMQAKLPLFESEWKGKTGASEPMPPMDENWTPTNEKWSKTVTIDFPKMQQYAKAVYSATDEYVNSLSDADLEKEIDLGSWGKKTVAQMLSGFVISHACSLAGELSALKGIQGARGYPF